MKWRSWFNLNLDPTQNSFLRLNEADRYRVAKRWLALFIGAMALFWFLRSVGLLSR
jgi:hypothetical protein